MAKPLVPVGESALLRLCGCPIEIWLSAGNPALFDAVHEAALARSQSRRASYTAADQLYAFLRQERRGLRRRAQLDGVDLVRRLRKALPPRPSDRKRLDSLVPSMGSEGLRNAVEEAFDLLDERERTQAFAETLLENEPARLCRTAWESVTRDPVLTSLFRDRTPGLVAEFSARVRRGEPWSRKGLRRKAAYIWKVLDRAAMRTTPRDWHCHAAVAPITDNEIAQGVHVDDAVATIWCDNIHSRRRRLAAEPAARDARCRLSLTPLLWAEKEHICCFVTDRTDPRDVTMIEMRRTQLLDRCYRALLRRAISVEALVEELCPRADKRERQLAHGFIDHLIRVGVLEASSTPRFETEPWRRLSTHELPTTSASEEQTPGGGKRQTEGYRDVYRRMRSNVALSLCRELQTMFVEARRLARLIELDARSERPAAASTDPAPLLDILRSRILAEPAAAQQPGRKRPSQSADWPAAKDPDSRYGRLLAWMNAQADLGQRIDITATQLDALGAPRSTLDWPADCIVRLPRVGADYAGVFAEAFPAGSLDARFRDALSQASTLRIEANGYREFLEHLQMDHGVRLVELLFPPLSEGAANAVRRPLYTNAWTGDPDIATYCAAGDRKPRYIPLDRLALRRRGGRLRVESDGELVYPMYHATRLPISPWNIVSEALLNAAPFAMRWSPRCLQRSLDAFPGRRYLPPVTVAGGLVIACAQWRVRPHELWQPAAKTQDKVLALDRLRRLRGLPRCVFISPGPGRRSRPCDLASLRALALLERAAADADDLLLIAVTPPPEDLLVADETHGRATLSSAAFMLRFPCDELPGAMAERVAPLLFSS